MLLTCSAVFADVHADCSDEECAATCSNICAHAVLSDLNCIGFDLNHYGHLFNHNFSLPLFSPEDVFQPPKF